MLETEAEILQASWLDMLPFEDQLLPHFPEHDADDKSRKGREGRASEDTSEHFGEGPLRYGIWRGDVERPIRFRVHHQVMNGMDVIVH